MTLVTIGSDNQVVKNVKDIMQLIDDVMKRQYTKLPT